MKFIIRFFSNLFKSKKKKLDIKNIRCSSMLMENSLKRDRY